MNPQRAHDKRLDEIELEHQMMKRGKTIHQKRLTRCGVTGKRIYPSKQYADEQAVRIWGVSPHRSYKCPACGFFHLTTKP